MAWLHTWSGLVVGWLLFAIFLTGTLSYLRPELSRWMRPEVSPPATAVSHARAVAGAARYLHREAPDAARWMIEGPTARDPLVHAVFWRDPAVAARSHRPAFGRVMLMPGGDQPVQARETLGADSLYYFHFDLLMPSVWGRLVVGLCTMAMLAALVSGVIIHRKLLAELFTFRPGRGQRSWLDGHNALGVLALPFHLVIAYSGLVTLMTLYLPWGLEAAYGDRTGVFYEATGQRAAIGPAAGYPAALAPLAPMVRAAEDRWDGRPVGRIEVFHPGDAAAVVILRRADEASVSFRDATLRFDGPSGAMLSTEPGGGGAAEARRVAYGLHVARFADPVSRGLLVLAGLAGTGVMATGLVFWVRKRRRTGDPGPVRAFSGLWWVERLNIAALAGLPAGVAGLLLANRLLPPAMPGRAAWEVTGGFFLVWLAVGLWGFLRPRRKAWRDGWGLLALLLAAVPVASALTTGRGLPGSLGDSDPVFAAVDLGCLGLAVCAAGLARLAGRRGDR